MPRQRVLLCLLVNLSLFTALTWAQHYPPERQVDVTHVRIDVIPDFEHHTIAGSTKIDFTPLVEPLIDLILNAKDMEIIRITSDQPIEAWSYNDIDITVSFVSPIPVGQPTHVQIWHDAQPQKGIYFRTAKNGYPAEDAHLFSQGEAHEAQYWYPNYDYPNDRFTSEVICQVPAGMTVLSNGRKVDESVDTSTGLKAVHWSQDKPHVNYLIALAAGYFKGITSEVNGIPLGFYVPASQIDLAQSSFKDTADMITFYEHEIGVPYPWAGYNQATCYDFVAGGMENTTLTLLTNSALHPEELEPLRSSTMLVAHELAHQWFGDYLTCEDWTHLWLNEGFATYYENLYSQHQLGRDEFLYNMYQDAGILTHRSGPQKAIFDRDYEDPDDQFDTRAYQKGGWVLHMLRCQLGDDLFRQCVKTYVERHALGTVETADLRQIVEEYTGRSFDRFFDQWVYTPGLPHLDLSYQWSQSDKMAKITLKQKPARSDIEGTVWSLPVTLRFWIGDTITDHEFPFEQAEQTVYVPLPAEPNLVRFDPEYTLLAEVIFNKPKAMLYEQLSRNDDIIGQLWTIDLLDDHHDLKTIEHLKQALNNSPFHQVRHTAAFALSGIHTDEAFDALTQSLDQSMPHARQAVVCAIGEFYRSEARDLLLDVLTDEMHPDIASEALTSLGRFYDPEVQEALIAALDSQSFRQTRMKGALWGMLKQKDEVFVIPLMQTLNERQEELPSEAIEVLLRTLGSCGKSLEDTSGVRELLCQYLNHPYRPIQESSLVSLGSLGDPKAEAAIESLTRLNDDLADTATRTLDKLREKEPNPLPSEVKELRESVKTLQENNDALELRLRDLEDRLDASGKH